MTEPATRAGSQRSTIRWRQSGALVPYPDALAAMESHVEAIREGRKGELGWLLEHPPLYTGGTSAKAEDLLVPNRFPVYETGRGGQYTYHGPGQRVAYMMLDLRRRGQDLRRYVWQLEEWIIETLGAFDIEGGRREGRIGIWVVKPNGQEAKVAAIGVRVRRWITLHGIAINLDPDLNHFTSIVPCGLQGYGVTSIADLGGQATMAELDQALMTSFEHVFSDGAAIADGATTTSSGAITSENSSP
ncbi:MAG: lipoyl(octanoyl) transferase LipB [Geminicoccaceae bacterium]